MALFLMTLRSLPFDDYLGLYFMKRCAFTINIYKNKFDRKIGFLLWQQFVFFGREIVMCVYQF